MKAFALVFCSAVITTVFFNNCSGGMQTTDGRPADSSNSGTQGNNGQALSSIDDLIGNWRQRFCAISDRSVFQVAKVDSRTIQFSQNLTQYSVAGCPGTGVLGSMPSDLGDIEFYATSVDGSHRHFRGDWTTPMGTKSKAIWALMSATTLCVMSDSDPTSLPAATAITSYVNLTPQFCYDKF